METTHRFGYELKWFSVHGLLKIATGLVLFYHSWFYP